MNRIFISLQGKLRKHKVLVSAALGGVVLVVIVAVIVGRTKPPPPPPAPLEVEVVQVQQQDVPIYSEWIGTTDGMVNADDSGSSFRLHTQEGLHRRCFRKTGTVAVRDRSAAASGSTQSG